MIALRRLLLRAARPALRLLGRWHTPPHFRSVTDEEVADLRFAARPGDVLVSRRDWELTNLLIPGFWKHAAIVCGRGLVVEAVGTGVQRMDLAEFARTKDAVLCLRPRFANETIRLDAAAYARTYVGRPYDYAVELDHAAPAVRRAFYCAEVVWAAYVSACAAMNADMPFTLRETLGVPTVTPQDFANATTKWDVVARVGRHGL